MDLPEIRHHLAQYLDNSSLAAAAVVCKSWNTTFTPILYSCIGWSKSQSSINPSRRVVQARANDVRILRFTTNGSKVFPFEALTRLEELRFTLPNEDCKDMRSFLYLVNHNPLLRSVDLSLCDSRGIQKTMMEAISRCQKLRKLHLTVYSLGSETAEYLFNICVRLQEMSIDIGDNIRIDSMDKWTEFSEIRKLHLKYTPLNWSRQPSHNQLDIVRKCPRLTSLLLAIDTTNYEIQDIYNILSVAGPQLKELSLSTQLDQRLSDNHYAQTLITCTSLTSLTLHQANVGPAVLQSLHPRLSSLTVLHIKQCTGFSSSMAQEIMMSCPLLTSLTLTMLEARDVFGIRQDEEFFKESDNRAKENHPPKWVCLHLKYFSVQICGLKGKSIEWHQRVFQQLARLERLEQLDFSLNNFRKSHSKDGLSLKVDAGLDALASLRRLESISFLRMEQIMDEKDIQWMIQTWLRLKKVCGTLHINRTEAWKLGARLKEHGVILSR